MWWRLCNIIRKKQLADVYAVITIIIAEENLIIISLQGQDYPYFSLRLKAGNLQTKDETVGYLHLS